MQVQSTASHNFVKTLVCNSELIHAYDPGHKAEYPSNPSLLTDAIGRLLMSLVALTDCVTVDNGNVSVLE